MHYDWLEAGEHIQRTLAQLSQQLRRFLDDKAWLENRRIMYILCGIEHKATAVRDMPPDGPFSSIAGVGADIELPMERPLYTPGLNTHIADLVPDAEDIDMDTAALFLQVLVGKLEKPAALEGEKPKLEARLAELGTRIAKVQEEQRALGKRQETLAKLDEYRDFQELDWRSPATAVARLEEEQRELENASGVLKQLTERLHAVAAQLEETEAKLEARREDRARLAQRREDA